MEGAAALIAILLASYQGENFIEEQIQSILAQTVQDFVLYIGDDGSHDQTAQIAKRYAKAYPDKIVFTQREKNSGSAHNNFLSLMAAHRQEYVMLCDQDDIWERDKIEKSLRCMQKAQEQFGKDTPILVHSDLSVADRSGQITAPSYSHAVLKNPNRTQLHYLLAQNIVTGCTAMYNLALADILREPKGPVVMHDWWLALVAGAFGKIVYLNEATVRYRQHGENTVGVRQVRSAKYLWSRLQAIDGYKQELHASCVQAQTFLSTYEDKLGEQQKKLLGAYAGIPKKNWLARRILPLWLKTTKYGMIKKVAAIFFG